VDVDKRFKYWQWRVLLVSALFYCFVYLGRLNWGLAASDLIRTLHITKADVGTGVAALLWGYAIGQAVNGRLSDHFGGRYWATLGAVGTVALNWAISALTSAPMLFGLLMVNGFFQAMIFPSLLRLTAQWWPSRWRGFQTGFLLAAAGASAVVAFAVSGWFIAHFGWVSAFRYPPLLILVSALAYFVLVRESPEDVGLPPYTETRKDVAAHEAVNEGELRGLGNYRYLLTQKMFLSACAMGFISNIGRYGLLTWIPLYYFQTSGISVQSAIWAQIGLPIGTALGPLFAGLISDRLFGSSRWQTLALSFAGAAVGLVVLALVPIRTLGIPLTFAVLIIAGFFIHGGGGSAHALAGDLGGRKMQGTAHGVLDAANYIGAGGQGIAIGTILDYTNNNWTMVFLIIGGLLFVGCLMAIGSGRNSGGKAKSRSEIVGMMK